MLHIGSDCMCGIWEMPRIDHILYAAWHNSPSTGLSSKPKNIQFREDLDKIYLNYSKGHALYQYYGSNLSISHPNLIGIGHS